MVRLTDSYAICEYSSYFSVAFRLDVMHLCAFLFTHSAYTFIMFDNCLCCFFAKLSTFSPSLFSSFAFRFRYWSELHSFHSLSLVLSICLMCRLLSLLHLHLAL